LRPFKAVIAQVKAIINGNVSSATGNYKSLNELGFSFDKTGVMSIDTS
jgi:flagellar capping protein FliD